MISAAGSPNPISRNSYCFSHPKSMKKVKFENVTKKKPTPPKNVFFGNYSDTSFRLCFHRLKDRVDSVFKKAHSSNRKEKMSTLLNEKFIFPKSDHEEMYEHDLLVEKIECDEIILQYQRDINRLKAKWENLEDHNNNLKEVIKDQNILHDDMTNKH